jgi:cytoskeletal protein CcmA (bactofilin family)
MSSTPHRKISLFSAGLTVHGDLILDHGISIFGIVDGSAVSTSGLLHIGLGGLLRGPLQGEHVRIDGTVEGNVYARATIEINGRVRGDIHYEGTIRLGPLASLEGKIIHVKTAPQIGTVAMSRDTSPVTVAPVAGVHVVRPAPEMGAM